MKKILDKLFILVLLFSFSNCSSNNDNPAVTEDIVCTPTELSVDYLKATQSIAVVAPGEWTAYSNDSWISCSPSSFIDTKGTITVTISSNPNKTAREGLVVVKSGASRISIPVKQAAKPDLPVDPNIPVPEGYKMVWNDEFTEGIEPGEEWTYETGGGGWGNNELQTYVAAYQGAEQLATVKDGTLAITAKKIGGTVYSIRMNTKQSWKYGYFEAKLKLPKGKGTWPAFWMMPKNYTAWPADGEIDIMEEVGYRPNYVSSAIHCTAYNHVINTQKTAETFLATAQSEYHIYALEWTEDYIRTLVDGKELFYFANDKAGKKETWPFNAAFYIKLNLAWGGNWGGAEGVDESALPATYEIDYVRVFQKE